MTLSRRKFVKRSSMLAAGSVLPIGCSDGTDSIGTRRAIVIGSGFAGSVAALRLGLAGIPTIVLERGQQWSSDTVTAGAEWNIPPAGLPSSGGATSAGLLETIPGANIDAVCGACVGGGSLVYGGVLIQPPRDTFEQVFPYLSYDEMDSVYYPRVIEKIGAAPIPDDVLESPTYAAHRRFIEDTAALGYDTWRTNASFDWDIIREEIAGNIPAEVSIGNYAPLPPSNNAKLSTDKNYLREAIATGFVELRSLTEVEIISEASPVGYSVVCRNITPEGELVERYELNARYLFLAAGSMNTSKLLLKSQQAGELRDANSRIGEGWGTNGDELLAQFHPDVPPGAQGGPACIAATDRTNSDYPVTFMHSPVSGAIQLQLAMSVPDALGRLGYDASNGSVVINWDSDSSTASAMARRDSFERLLIQNGGAEVPFISGTIWHPLGGAPMNDACDHMGQLYGYDNLFVIDGSLLPGSAGAANPALTIAANAERIMESLIPTL